MPTHRAGARVRQRAPASRSRTLWTRTCSMNVLRIRQLPGVATMVLLLTAVAAVPVQAQQGSVTGQVTDKSSQQPVAGAQVLIVGTSLQARTSREGRYSIAKVPAGQY